MEFGSTCANPVVGKGFADTDAKGAIVNPVEVAVCVHMGTSETYASSVTGKGYAHMGVF